MSKQQDRWNTFLNRWRDRLWLNNYRLGTKAMTPAEQTESDNALARVDVSEEYQFCDVAINEAKSETMDDKTINESACHEMVHVMLADEQNFGDALVGHAHESERAALTLGWKKAFERTTTNVANVLLHSGIEWTVVDAERCRHDKDGC